MEVNTNVQEMIDKIHELEERNKVLENMVARGNSRNSSAYNEVRAMIIEKVQNEVCIDEFPDYWQDRAKQKAERQVMSDLKWELRIRTIADFKLEHIEPAREFIKNYILAEDLKHNIRR